MRKFFFLALLPLLLWGDAHIFVYHRFGDSEHAATNTSVEVLRAEFDHLKNNGFKVIPLERLRKAFQNGEPIDKKWVVLTIDDNYKSFDENGLPLFNDLEELATAGPITLGLTAGAIYGLYKFGRYAWSWLCEKIPLTGKTRDEYLKEQYPDVQFLIDSRYHEF